MNGLREGNGRSVVRSSLEKERFCRRVDFESSTMFVSLDYTYLFLKISWGGVEGVQHTSMYIRNMALETGSVHGNDRRNPFRYTPIFTSEELYQADRP